MGLDSVELVLEIEKHFGISIPDPEAEKVYTVQSMVDVVAKHLMVTNDSMELRDKIFERLNNTLLKLELTDKPVTLIGTISSYLSPDKESIWEAFKKELQLNVPTPESAPNDSKRFIDKLRAAISWTPMYNWSSITVDHFIAVICSNNYEILIDRKQIKTIYEIFIAVSAITADIAGVDYYEITPEKSFTSDLGID